MTTPQSLSNRNTPRKGVVCKDITDKDLLTPFQDFEQRHNIADTRNDIPKKFLGFSPSKYYRYVDMDVEKLAHKVEKLLLSLSLKSDHVGNSR